MEPLPHPVTGQVFASPVPPGTGWPGDPAAPDTPVAKTPAGVRRLARGASSEHELQARASVCRACPRLVAWREEVAATGRRAYTGQTYWGRPVPSLGPGSEHRSVATEGSAHPVATNPVSDAWLMVLVLAPAAHGANRTGRVFTGDRSGDWIFAALHRAGLATQATSVHAGDGPALIGTRIAAPVKCAPPENKPTPAERDTCAPWLDRELALTSGSLRAIVALGGFAWDAALAMATRQGWDVPRPRPKFGHGAEATFEREGAGAVHLVGCYHVSQQNTFTGRLTEPMLDAVLAQAAKYR